MTAPAAASRNNLNNSQPSTSRPPKIPNQENNNNSANTNNSNSSSSSSHAPLILSEQDKYLSRATHLTRHELLKRRSFNLKQLSKCYKDYYWALMEDLKVQYREYYWKYGVSPIKEEIGGGGGGGDFERENGNNVNNGEVVGENGNGNISENKSSSNNNNNNNNRCLFVGCKLKAMALTSFCHLHILSDAKQKLYKPCGYVIKSAHAGPITCGKPILISSVPSLCTVHFQKAQKHVTRALKKAGLNVNSSSKLAPKFHVIVSEYVRQIQTKRKANKRVNKAKALDKEASVS